MQSKIYEVDHEVLEFLSDFAIDIVIGITPELKIEKLKENKDLKLVHTSEESYLFTYKDRPLMAIDLKMLLDGA